MADNRMLKVAPAPSEVERLDRIRRETLEHVNAKLTDEIAPALRAEILAELKGTLEETRRIAFDHGHAHAMSKGWRFLVIGAAAGFFACALMYGVATTQGAAIAKAEAANNEIRKELDNR